MLAPCWVMQETVVEQVVLMSTVVQDPRRLGATRRDSHRFTRCERRVRSSVVGQAQEQAGGQRHELQGTAFDQGLPTRAPHSSRGRWQIIEQERDLLGCTARSKVVAEVVEL